MAAGASPAGAGTGLGLEVTVLAGPRRAGSSLSPRRSRTGCVGPTSASGAAFILVRAVARWNAHCSPPCYPCIWFELLDLAPAAGWVVRRHDPGSVLSPRLRRRPSSSALRRAQMSLVPGSSSYDFCLCVAGEATGRCSGTYGCLACWIAETVGVSQNEKPVPFLYTYV